MLTCEPSLALPLVSAEMEGNPYKSRVHCKGRIDDEVLLYCTVVRSFSTSDNGRFSLLLSCGHMLLLMCTSTGIHEVSTPVQRKPRGLYPCTWNAQGHAHFDSGLYTLWWHDLLYWIVHSRIQGLLLARQHCIAGKTHTSVTCSRAFSITRDLVSFIVMSLKPQSDLSGMFFDNMYLLKGLTWSYIPFQGLSCETFYWYR